MNPNDLENRMLIYTDEEFESYWGEPEDMDFIDDLEGEEE